MCITQWVVVGRNCAHIVAHLNPYSYTHNYRLLTHHPILFLSTLAYTRLINTDNKKDSLVYTIPSFAVPLLYTVIFFN